MLIIQWYNKARNRGKKPGGIQGGNNYPRNDGNGSTIYKEIKIGVSLKSNVGIEKEKGREGGS